MSQCKMWGVGLLLLGVVAVFPGCKKPEGTATPPPATAPAAEPAPAPSGTTDAP